MSESGPYERNSRLQTRWMGPREAVEALIQHREARLRAILVPTLNQVLDVLDEWHMADGTLFTDVQIALRALDGQEGSGHA